MYVHIIKPKRKEGKQLLHHLPLCNKESQKYPLNRHLYLKYVYLSSFRRKKKKSTP